MTLVLALTFRKARAHWFGFLVTPRDAEITDHGERERTLYKEL